MTDFGWVPWAVTVVVALIGLAGVVLGRVVHVPVTTQDLWKETRDLRAELAEIRDQYDADRSEREKLRETQDALVRWLQKVADGWHDSDTFPMPDEADLKILELTIPRVPIRPTRARRPRASTA